MCRHKFPAIGIGILSLIIIKIACAGNWPGWRGDGSGISAEMNLPLAWSDAEGVAWKTPLPGEGNSSPVIWGDKIFLTASEEKGVKRLVLCYSTKDGKELWRQTYQPEKVLKNADNKSGYASPSAVTDGAQVFAFFDTPGVVALAVDGQKLWEYPVGPFKAMYNVGISPVLYKDMVIQIYDNDEKGKSFIVALDKKTGQPRWKTPRAGGLTYATPILIEVKGKTQLVAAAQTVIAYDPETGAEIWSCKGLMECVAPSPVWGGDAPGSLVYATSGRNGPTLAIDPTGTGDVTQTHVKYQLATGGPYVISPVFLSSNYTLVIPGDNGDLRFINERGEKRFLIKAPGHYSSSPILDHSEGLLCWTTESGDTYIIQVGGNLDSKEEVKIIAKNSLKEKVLASPAHANNRLYIRGDKHLFCISGTDGLIRQTEVAKAIENFDDLAAKYKAHPDPEGPDVGIRIEIAEALAQVQDPRAITLLLDIALKDAHWDPSEAAAKALGAHGVSATAAYIALMKDFRVYNQVLGAQYAGNVRAEAALPEIYRLAKEGDRLVRMAVMRALGQYAQAGGASLEKNLPYLLAGVKDAEAGVRLSAVEALAGLAENAGDQRESIIAALQEAKSDANPQVAEKATTALKDNYKVSKVENTINTQVKSEYLQAGPLRVKFQDGELRYLQVGGKEVVRRIYFAVRDSGFDTVMPQFRQVEIKKENGGFQIKLDALCRSAKAEFAWKGVIQGQPDGTLTFKVTGAAERDFQSPRVGMCVLFGAGALAGKEFVVTDAAGKTFMSQFPQLVSKDPLAEAFQSISITPQPGVSVTVSLAGGFQGMEDQRVFGDSSYKAYSGFDYKYPEMKKGQQGGQELTLKVASRESRVASQKQEEIVVRVGQPLEGIKLPRLSFTDKKMNADGMLTYHFLNQKRAAAEKISWIYTPVAHQPDDDTIMENLPGVLDQARTIRSWAPQAKLAVEMFSINSPYERPGADPRNDSPLAAAWATALLKYLALGGVEEAAGNVGSGLPEWLRASMAEHAGATLLYTQVPNEGRPTVEPLAINIDNGILIWLINTTEQPQKFIISNSSPRNNFLKGKISSRSSLDADGPSKSIGELEGNFELKPFEVVEVKVTKQ